MRAATSAEQTKKRVLIIDDEVAVLRTYARIFEGEGFDVSNASDGPRVRELLAAHSFDIVLADLAVPVDGLELLRAVREHDLDVPILVVTGAPTVESAIAAVNAGALRYLIKPVAPRELTELVKQACQLHGLAKLKRRALELLGDKTHQIGDRAGLEATFERALASMRLVFQPIVRSRHRRVFGYEALLRTDEPLLPTPPAVIDAAEQLGRVDELGRRIRARLAVEALVAPNDALLFVNLNASDLLDGELLSPASPLSTIADRVVLEVTERASLHDMADLAERVASLRAMGFRIAVDDLGAGYAGLTAFAQLQPEVVKLDMSLVRNIHRDVIKQRLVSSMVSLCRDMNMMVVAEGVETNEERRSLDELGCDLLQGYLFARPAAGFTLLTTVT